MLKDEEGREGIDHWDVCLARSRERDLAPVPRSRLQSNPAPRISFLALNKGRTRRAITMVSVATISHHSQNNTIATLPRATQPSRRSI